MAGFELGNGGFDQESWHFDPQRAVLPLGCEARSSRSLPADQALNPALSTSAAQQGLRLGGAEGRTCSRQNSALGGSTPPLVPHSWDWVTEFSSEH